MSLSLYKITRKNISEHHLSNTDINSYLICSTMESHLVEQPLNSKNSPSWLSGLSDQITFFLSQETCHRRVSTIRFLLFFNQQNKLQSYGQIIKQLKQHKLWSQTTWILNLLLCDLGQDTLCQCPLSVK